jgi:hypothetical protein
MASKKIAPKTDSRLMASESARARSVNVLILGAGEREIPDASWNKIDPVQLMYSGSFPSALTAEHVQLFRPPQLHADDRSVTISTGRCPAFCCSLLPSRRMLHMLDPVLSRSLFFE